MVRGYATEEHLKELGKAPAKLANIQTTLERYAKGKCSGLIGLDILDDYKKICDIDCFNDIKTLSFVPDVAAMQTKVLAVANFLRLV